MTTDLRTVDFVTDIETSYRDYAIETIIDRALPRVEDGLKPVQRRILYAMHDLGLHPTKPYKKSARVVGEVLGKYHPHGDASVYGAMVRLAQDFSLEHPLIDGQGNFGSIDGDAPAAMRYTEARLAWIADLMMQDIERETVDWIDNFDGSLKEPEILPAVLPNLLVNGVSGVAVGVTTNMPPHNLGEVCDGLLYLLEQWPRREKVTVDELMNFIPGPDFPTGGLVYRYRVDQGGAGEAVADTIRAAYETGRGRIVTQARIATQGGRGGKADLVITELPYAVQKSTVLERIAKEVRDGRISGVTDLRDESDYSGLRIVVELSRQADPAQVLESLLSYTQLRQTFGVINRALKKEDGEVIPHLYSLRDLLADFIGHRLLVVERRSRHELAQREARLHIVEGLLKALDIVDEVIATIRTSKNTDTARQNLVKKFNLSEVQAQAILEMQLRQLAALERQKLSDERRELQARLKELQELLASETKRLAVIAVELLALKEKFAIPRRTIILDSEGQAAGLAVAAVADPAEPAEAQVVAVTTRGVWRGNRGSFSDKIRPGISAKAIETQLCRLHLEPTDGLVLVSNRGRAWRAAVGRVPEKAGFAELGLAKGETIIGAGLIDPEKYLVVGSRAGRVKRVQLKELAMAEAAWATMIGLKDQKDELLFAAVAGDKASVMFFTAGGQAIRFSASQVSPQPTPSAKGVTGIKIGPDDTLIAGAVVEDERANVLIVSQAGYIKSVPLGEFPLQGRGGQGVQSLHITKATGPAAAAAVARPGARSCDIISGRELRCRVPVQDIPLADRRQRGAKLVELGPDDVIAAAVTF